PWAAPATHSCRLPGRAPATLRSRRPSARACARPSPPTSHLGRCSAPAPPGASPSTAETPRAHPPSRRTLHRLPTLGAWVASGGRGAVDARCTRTTRRRPRGSERTIALTSAVVTALSDTKPLHTGERDFVFRNIEGRPVFGDSFSKHEWHRALR